MADAWLALAEEQDWLDGEISPNDPAPAGARPGGEPQGPVGPDGPSAGRVARRAGKVIKSDASYGMEGAR